MRPFATGLSLRVNLRALLHELLRLLLHAFLQGIFLGDRLFGGVFADVFGDVDDAAAPQHRPAGNAARCLSRFSFKSSAHRAEVRAALLNFAVCAFVGGSSRMKAQETSAVWPLS